MLRMKELLSQCKYLILCLALQLLDVVTGAQMSLLIALCLGLEV